MMDTTRLDKSWQTYLQAFRHTNQRWLDAQQDMMRTLAAAWSSGMILDEDAVSRHLDGGLTAGNELLQAQADAQRDLMLLVEKTLAELQCQMLTHWSAPPGSPQLVRSALEVGQASSSAMSRMSRQIGHFAATNFSQATVNATRQLRRAIHPSCRGK